MNHLPDIYFTPQYGRLYERHEGGVCTSFTHQSRLGEVYFQFIKRPLEQFEGFSDYSDIVTPYGYGGPIFLRVNDDDKPALAAEFGGAFQEYCRENRIVSAFVRFHPVIGNALQFGGVFDDVVPIRKTVAIDLLKDIFVEEFDRTIRSSYNKAELRQLTVEYDPALKTMDHFISLYYALMDSKNTSDYYYFPKEYFEEIKKLGDSVELVNAVQDGEIVATVLYLKYNVFIHSHLTASTPAGNICRAVEVIKSNRALRAKEEGFRWNHLGGGFSNEPDDTLLRFKRKFSKGEPLDFYIGKCVYDRDAYDALCALTAGRQRQNGDGFFPKYRV
jgi:hypothetical protein